MRTHEDMTMLSAALKLGQKGTAVFPCASDKSPRVAGGFKAATTNQEDILAWGDLWDDAMIGAAIPEGTVIIDVDPRNGGAETMTALVNSVGSLPTTRLVRTRSGGDHWYYSVPEDTVLRPSLGPGVDVKRAGKGYVIVPPSEGYTYLKGGEPVPMPDWLLEELRVEERPASEHEASAPKYLPFENGTTYGLAALKKSLGELVMAQEGERNNTLNKVAFGMAQLATGGELNMHHAMEALFETALLIGLNEGEARATIASGMLAGEQEPRQAPERNELGSPGDAVPQDGSAVAGTGEPAPFKWVSWEVDEPEPPFFAHPVLPKNAYVLVYGATEAAKSMTWLGLLAEGSIRGLRSSIYSLENPPSTDRDRLRRWAPDPGALRLTNEPLNLFDVSVIDAMIQRELEWGTDVVMIDTYSHAFHSHNEDGNAKAIAFARVVRRIMAAVGCSFVVIDHTGFVGDEPRDASAKRQQVDVAIHMEKNGDWVAGQPARFTMTNRKAARFGNPFYMGGSIEDGLKRKLELRWASGGPTWRL